MSTIDSKVVEMRFDNSNFESNVKTSLGTIQRLKQALNFSGAAKGLSGLGTAASKCDMSPLGKSVDSVKSRFTSLDYVAGNVLSNIAVRAQRAGEQLIKAFTIDPIKTGFQEYETQINAIQTVLANTESKGTTLDDVNAALDELNLYADKTIYNFTEMTKNIGTFTAAGIELETAVNSIQGIANLAAVSGSTSQQASTAMYQLSQALASGTVKLMDWNSVVDAGMGGQVFQDALKETARAHGVAIDKMIKKEGSFRETLSKGWLTSEILTETLSKFTMTTEGLTEAQIEQNRAMWKSKGYTDEQIDGIFKLGNTATNAATKVKTFTQLMSTMKESVQSGWTQSWELVVGDFEEAKELWTGISNYIGDILQSSSNKRNAILSGALTSNWDKLVSEIRNAGIETETFEKAMQTTLDKHNFNVEDLLKKYGSYEEIFRSGIVSSKHLQEAVDSLSGSLVDLSGIQDKLKKGDTGEDVKKIQTALEALGYDLGKFGTDGVLGKYTESAIKAFQEASGLKVTGIVDDATIKALEEASGKTDELSESVSGLVDNIDKLGGRENIIEGFSNIFNSNWDKLVGKIEKVGIGTSEFSDELRTTLEKHGFNVDYLLEKYGSFEGIFKSGVVSSEYLQESVNNLDESLGSSSPVEKLISQVTELSGIETILKPIGDAFSNIFGIPIDDKVDFIYGLTEKFKDLTSNFKISEESAAKLKTTFEGLFSIFDMIKIPAALLVLPKIIKGLPGPLKSIGLKIGIFTGLLKVLGLTGVSLEDVLNFTSKIGEKITGFGDKIEELGGIGGVFELLKPKIGGFIDELSEKHKGFGSFVDGAKSVFGKVGNYFSGGITRISEFIDRVKSMDSISLDNIETIFKDFKDNVADYFLDINIDFKKIGESFGTALTNIKDWFMNLSFDDIGSGISDFIDGIKSNFEGAEEVFDSIKEKATKVIDFLSDSFTSLSNFIKAVVPAVLAVVGGGFAIKLMGKLSNAIDAIFSPFDTVAESAGKGGKFAANLTVMSEGILNLALAIGVLMLGIKLIGDINKDKLWSAVGVIAALGGVVLAMAALSSLISKLPGGTLIPTASILAISISLTLLVGCLKTIEGFDKTQIASNIGTLSGLAALLIGLAVAVGFFNKEGLSKSALGILSMAIAIKLIVGALEDVIEITSELRGSKDGMKTLWTSLGIIAGVMIALGALIRICSGTSLGSMFGALSLVFSLKMMIGVLEDIAAFDPQTILKNIDSYIAVFGSLAVLLLMSNFASGGSLKGGIGILAMVIALKMLIGLVEDIAQIDEQGSLKAATNAMSKLIVFLGIAVAVTRFAGNNALKAAGLILAFSAALWVLTGALSILSLIKEDNLDKALSAVERIGLVFSVLMVASGWAAGSIGTMVVLTVALGILSGLLVGMSFFAKTDDNRKAMETATECISMLIGMFALLVASTRLMPNAGLLKVSGMLLVITAIVRVLAYILSKINGLNPESSIGNVEALSILLLSISGACLILSKIKPLLPGALNSAAKMIGLVGLVAGIILGIGAIVASIKDSEDFLDKTISVLEKMGNAIGSFFGGILGGFAGGTLSSMSSKLPKVSEDIETFVTNITEALGVEDVNELIGIIKNLGSAAAEIPNIKISGGLSLGLTDIALSGSYEMPDFDGFIKYVEEIGPALVELNNALSGITVPEGGFDTTVLDALTGALESLATSASLVPYKITVQAGILNDSVTINKEPDFTGFTNWIDTVVDSISGLIKDLNNEEVIPEFSKSKLEAVLDAITKVSEAASLVPSITTANGILATLLGGFAFDVSQTPDFSGFKLWFTTIVSSVKDLVTTINDEDQVPEFSKTRLTAIVDAITAISEAGSNVPMTTLAAGLVKAIGISAGGALWQTPDFTGFSTWITTASAGVIQILRALDGVTLGEDGSIVKGEGISESALEKLNTVIGAVQDLSAASTLVKNSKLTAFGGGFSGLKGFLNGGGVGFSQESAQYTEFANWITNAGFGVVAVIKAIEDVATEDGKPIEITEEVSTKLGYITQAVKDLSEASKNMPTKEQTKALWTAVAGTVGFGGGGTTTKSTDFTGFSNWISTIGTSLSTFITTVKGVDIGELSDDGTTSDVMKKVSAVIGVLNSLITISDNIPPIENTDGLFKDIESFTDFTGFSSWLTKVGPSLDTFIGTAAGITLSNVGTDGGGTALEKVTALCTVLGSLAEAASNVPTKTEMEGWFLSYEEYADVTGFTDWIAEVAPKIAEFAQTVSGSNYTFDLEIVSTIADSLNKLAEAMNFITQSNFTSAGIASTDISTKITEMLGIFETISNGVAEGKINLTDVNVFATACRNLSVMLLNLKGIGEDGVDTDLFKTNLDNVATAVSDFTTKMTDNDPTTAISHFNALVNTVKDASTINAEGIVAFESALKAAAGVDLSAYTQGVAENYNTIADALKGIMLLAAPSAASEEVKEAFKASGKTAAGELGTGISDESVGKSINDSAEGVASAAGTSAGSQAVYDAFYSSGSYVVGGLAAGISDGKSEAISAAVGVMEAAIVAAEEAAGIESPSKVTYEMGGFLIKGLTNSLHDGSGRAQKSAKEMMERVRLGFGNSIAKIHDLISSGIDTQPTIRPVVDLSDVTYGANRINSMFGLNPSVGILSNVGSINRMMNKNQNGTNNDIISAIRDLKDTVGISSGDTYQINGVTYDDGSNIANAVRTLVRASIVERRI